MRHADLGVDLPAVGHLGLAEDAVAQGPVFLVQLGHHAEIVPANVGRIVPSAVVHQVPVHKLRARVVAVAIVVEPVRGRHSPGRNRQPRDVLVLGQLIRAGFDLLLLAAEADRLLHPASGHVRVASGRPTRVMSPLGKAEIPNTSLSPRPPETSGLKYTSQPCQSRAPRNRVEVAEVAVSCSGRKLLVPS